MYPNGGCSRSVDGAVATRAPAGPLPLGGILGRQESRL